MPLDPARTKAIDTAITAIERQYGKGAIMRMDGKERPKVASISTGSIGLDVALGIGGMPQGRIVEVYGAESSGKTTLTLHIVAEAQRKGQVAAFIDAEHALDLQYAEALGVEVGKDTVPLTVPYNWECVRDCPWKGPNARLLVRYAEYLSKFRVCVHSLSLAKR